MTRTSPKEDSAPATKADIAELRQLLDHRFEEIDKKLLEHDRRFDRIDRKLEEYDDSFAVLIRYLRLNADDVQKQLNDFEQNPKSQVSIDFNRRLRRLEEFVGLTA